MTQPCTLTSLDIQEIGEALYGKVWQSDMARGIGVPRQSIIYYLKAGGVNRTQASAIVGLVARLAASERRSDLKIKGASEARQVMLANLLLRFDGA